MPPRRNDLYLTYAAPVLATPLYHTLLDLGSTAAAGQDTENGTMTQVWNRFKNGGLATVGGTTLHYYESHVNGNVTTQALLGTGDGECAAWTSFFLDVLKAQGIEQSNDFVQVKSYYSGFLVNNWQFAAGGGTSIAAIDTTGRPELAAALPDYPYLNLWSRDAEGHFFVFNGAGNGYSWMPGADVTDLNGTAGQSNENPASAFEKHQFAQLDMGSGTQWFDPSYGTVYDGATEAARLLRDCPIRGGLRIIPHENDILPQRHDQ